MIHYISHNVRKHTFWHVRITMTQISLRISVIWSDSSMSAWRNFAPLSIQNAPNEDSDQTARMRSLIWIFAGHTCRKLHFLPLWPIALNTYFRYQLILLFKFILRLLALLRFEWQAFITNDAKLYSTWGYTSAPYQEKMCLQGLWDH